MTDTSDTNCPRCGEHLNYGCNCTAFEIEASYREAAALDAANARIAELEAALIMRLSPSVAIDAKINVNAPKRFRATVKHEGAEVGDLPWLEEFWAIRHENHVSALATARAEALEEAERVCTCKICAATIRALKGCSNG